MPRIFFVFLLLLSSVAFGAQGRAVAGALEIGDWQGALPLGKYAYIANVPESQLKTWFTSPGRVLDGLIANIPDSMSLPALAHRSGGALKWRRSTGKRLFLDAPSRLNLVAIDLVYSGAGEKSLLLDMSYVDGIAWQYRDESGKRVGFADDFSKPLGGRSVRDTRAIIPLHLKSGHRYRLYIAAFTVSKRRHAWMSLWNGEQLRAKRIGLHIMDGGYFGLIVALVVYNIFLYAAIRRYPYLFFALFVAASGGEIALASGLLLFFMPFPDALPTVYLFQGSVELFGALFSMSLMNVRNTNRTLYYLWSTVVALVVASTAIIVRMAISRNGGYSVEPIDSTLYVAAFVWIVYQAVNLCTLVYYWSESRVARYWFLGITIHTWSLAAYPILIGVSANLSIDPYHLAQLATLLDTILLSALISYSFRSEQDSRVYAQRKSLENLRFALDLQRAKSEFVSTVGHDLRGPVQAISFFAQSLKHTSQKAVLLTLEKIDENIASVSELLDNLVRYSESEYQTAHPAHEEVFLAQLFGALKAEFEPRAAEKNIALEFDATRSMVMTDRVCLIQILRNLVDNAIKYTDTGQVKVGVEDTDEAVRISVEDSGRGIPDAELPNIFDEFYQVSGQETDVEGVGLGLSIVARLTRLLGVEVTVRSRIHSGTSFELRFDKEPEATDEPTLFASSTQVQKDTVTIVPQSKGTLGNLRVLIVSDNNTDVDSLRDRLLGWGASFCQVHSFPQALSFVDKRKWMPDVIIAESDLYGSVETVLDADELARLFREDVPVFVSNARNLRFTQDCVFRKNHMVIPGSMDAMKFRSLIQRSVPRQAFEGAAALAGRP